AYPHSKSPCRGSGSVESGIPGNSCQFMSTAFGGPGEAALLWVWFTHRCIVAGRDRGPAGVKLAHYPLREAASPQDQTSLLDGGILVAVWPELFLPKGVRQAWEELHPALRTLPWRRPDAGQ